MAGAIAQLPFADINGQRYAAIPNPSLKNKDGSPRSTWDHIVEYTKSANGAFRCLQFLERVTKLAVLVLKEMGSAMVGFFEDLAGKFGLAWAMLTLPRLPEVTKNAKKAICDWSKTPEGPATNATRDKIQKIHDIADATAAWGYAGSLLANNPAIKNMADIPNLVSDMTDLSMAAEDWSLAREHLKHVQAQGTANAPIQERFIDKMRESMLKMVKAVASVVSGVLGLLVLAFGGPVLPAIVLIAIGLTATVAAMTAHFFKETRTSDMVDFHKIRQPEVLVAGVRAA